MIGPRKVDKPLVLYGYGKLGHLAEEIFGELKIPIAGIFDKSRWSVCKSSLGPDQQEIALLAICIATEPYTQVIAPLIATGWKDIVPVWDIVEAYPEVGIGNGWFTEIPPKKPKKIDNDGVAFVLSNLSDNDRSHNDYLNFILWHQNHFESHPSSWWNPDLKNNPSLPSTLADIRARQRVIIYDRPQESVSIHAEGLELATLEANMDSLSWYRPKIECACYHSRDGLWKIEKYLMDNLENYIWTFRIHAYMGQGAYIYGTPKEML